MQFSSLFLLFCCQQLPTYTHINTHTSFSSSFVSHFVFWPLEEKSLQFAAVFISHTHYHRRIVAFFYIFLYFFSPTSLFHVYIFLASFFLYRCCCNSKNIVNILQLIVHKFLVDFLLFLYTDCVTAARLIFISCFNI